MAYSTGSVTSLAALRSALIDACVAAGWAWNSGSEMLSKATLFTKISITATDLQLLGRTSAAAGDAPNTVGIGRFTEKAGVPTYDLTWPLEYYLFVFTDPDEVYLVVRYDLDVFQWLGFGESKVAGMPGTGMWVSGSKGARLALPSAGTAVVSIHAAGGGYSHGNGWALLCPAFAWSTANAAHSTHINLCNTYVHSNLDGQGWLLTQAQADAGIGASAIRELLVCQPSAWNYEAALLPMRAYKVRPAARVSLVADLHNARYMRIDHLEPVQVVTLGDDRWMVFPWLQKNIAGRDGSANNSTSSAHSGTFGWAIRYEGP